MRWRAMACKKLHQITLSQSKTRVQKPIRSRTSPAAPATANTKAPIMTSKRSQAVDVKRAIKTPSSPSPMVTLSSRITHRKNSRESLSIIANIRTRTLRKQPQNSSAEVATSTTPHTAALGKSFEVSHSKRPVRNVMTLRSNLPYPKVLSYSKSPVSTWRAL